MKVVVFTPFFPPGVGGSGQLLADVALDLVRKGHTVTVLTYSFEPEAERSFDEGQPYGVLRVPAGRFHGLGSLRAFIALAKVCFRLRPAVVLCGAAFPTAIIAAVACAASRIKFVVYSHGEDVSLQPSQKLRRWFLARALSRATAVIANSSYTADRARGLCASHSHITVVHPWIDPRPFLSVDAARVEQIRETRSLIGRRVLLTVARLEERKGHDRVVEALPLIAQEIPNVSYLIIGKGDQARLRSLAQKHGVADRLQILSYVDATDLPAYYKLCDVFLMVSRQDALSGYVEGFGMVYLEAGAAGRACIAGNQGGSPDAVVEGETGFVVDPQDSAAIAAAAIRLLGQPEISQRMGLRALERVTTSFSAEKQLARIAALLTSAADGSA